jgi:hypothetical protein
MDTLMSITLADAWRAIGWDLRCIHRCDISRRFTEQFLLDLCVLSRGDSGVESRG